MLLNFQRNSHKGTLSQLLKYWQKEYSLDKTNIEFILEKSAQSYLYDKTNMHEFLQQLPIFELMLKEKKIWSLPLLIYYKDEVNNQTLAFQFILFDGTIKGFDEEQTKQCFGLNTEYTYKSSMFLLNKWNLKRVEMDN